MSGLIERIERLAESDPISLDSVDFTVQNPEVLYERLGKTFSYFARVEREVAADPLLTMMPRLGTTYRGYDSHGTSFVGVWVEQEQAHGRIFDRLQEELGMTPLTPNANTSTMNRLGGIAGHMSPWFHGVLEMVYLARGTMHERLTMQGYNLMQNQLEAMNEHAISQTIIKPIKPQEAGHLGYYRMAAQELKGHLSSRQLALARYISLKTYAPVGAGSDSEKTHFGHVGEALAGDDLPAFAAPIQRIAQELLTTPTESGEPDRELPRFVIASLQSCVDLARQEREDISLAA